MEKQANQEWSLVQNLYINDLELITAFFGIELIPIIRKDRKTGRLYPAMKATRRRWLPLSKADVAQLTGESIQRKREWMKMLKYKEEQLSSITVPSVSLSEIVGSYFSKKGFFRRFNELKPRYEAYLAPIIFFHPNGANPTYEVRPTPNAGQKPLPKD